MLTVPAASSEPTTATALGISGSSISERIKTKAPPSCHSNDVRPWNVVPGMSGCVPVVRHWPTNGASGSSAGLGRCASGPIGDTIRKIIADTQHGHAPGVSGHLGRDVGGVVLGQPRCGRGERVPGIYALTGGRNHVGSTASWSR